MQSPILAIADQDRPFHVVCYASDYAMGCALTQYDTDGAERVSAINRVNCNQLNAIIDCMARNALPRNMHWLRFVSICSKIDHLRRYGPCVITDGRKQSTPLANYGEVDVFLRELQALRRV